MPGLWKDEHTALLKRLADVITLGGAVLAIQLAHAGRKASCVPPWEGGAPILPEKGGWRPGSRCSKSIRGMVICRIPYLSPISNQRNDAYGGDQAGRSRFLMEVIDAVRAVRPAYLPLFIRLSCSDCKVGGLTIEDIVALCRKLKARGDADLIDCSSGGITPNVRPPSLHPGYPVPFAGAIKQGAEIATGAVGRIQDPQHAAEINGYGRADLVFVAHVVLADPAWPLRVAKALGVKLELAQAYGRALIH